MTYHLIYDERLTKTGLCYMFFITRPNDHEIYLSKGTRWSSTIPKTLETLLTSDFSDLTDGVDPVWLKYSIRTLSELPTLEQFITNYPELLI